MNTAATPNDDKPSERAPLSLSLRSLGVARVIP